MKIKSFIKQITLSIVGISLLPLSAQAENVNTLECNVSSHMNVKIDHDTLQFKEDTAKTYQAKTEKIIIKFEQLYGNTNMSIVGKGKVVGGALFNFYDNFNKRPPVNHFTSGGFISNPQQDVSSYSQFMVKSQSVSARWGEQSIDINKSSEGAIGFFVHYDYFNARMISFKCDVSDTHWKSFLNHVERHF